MRGFGRAAAVLAVLAVCGCGAFGRLDTAAIQTTNRAAGVPANGPAAAR